MNLKYQVKIKIRGTKQTLLICYEKFELLKQKQKHISLFVNIRNVAN